MTSLPRASAPRLADRDEAGRQLAKRLTGYSATHPVVVGIAPDGMPLAAEIARALGAPLDAVAVEPLTLDNAEAERFGTAAEGGTAFFDPERRAEADSHVDAVDAVLVETEARLQHRGAIWHAHHRRPSLRGRQVLLVTELLSDDQIVAAAACAVRDRGAAEVVCVTPEARFGAAVAAADWMDEIVCLELRDHEISPADGFEDRAWVSDETVQKLLRENENERRRAQQRRARR